MSLVDPLVLSSNLKFFTFGYIIRPFFNHLDSGLRCIYRSFFMYALSKPVPQKLRLTTITLDQERWT